MQFKNLALGFALAFLGMGLGFCKKKKSGVTVRVRVSDANTSKVWREKSSDGRLFVLAIMTGEELDGGRTSVTRDHLAGTVSVVDNRKNDQERSKEGLNLLLGEQIYTQLKGFGLSFENILHAIVKVAGYLADGEPLQVGEKLDESLQLVKGLEKLAGLGGNKAVSLIKGNLRRGKVISAGLKREIITDALVSAEDSNHNDAKISWIKVTYVDIGGKRVEDNTGEQPVGADFSKEYTLPQGQAITVTASAKQTGETRELAQEIRQISDRGTVHGIKQKTTQLAMQNGSNDNTLRNLENLAEETLESVKGLLSYYQQSGLDGKEA